jgi:hypothetical protein
MFSWFSDYFIFHAEKYFDVFNGTQRFAAWRSAEERS